MICESCHQEEATVLLTKISADQKQALHLCPTCAAQVAKSNKGEPASAGPEKAPHVEGEATEPKTDKPSAAKAPNAVTGHLPNTGKASDKTCSQCGMTYRQFRKHGRFGCEACYQAFGDELRRLMKRIHGAQTHVGKRPQAAPVAPSDSSFQIATEAPLSTATDDLEQLRADLEKAVQAEAYEQAAALRDRIGQLEAVANDAQQEDGR